jgi:hypothetical protein
MPWSDRTDTVLPEPINRVDATNHVNGINRLLPA